MHRIDTLVGASVPDLDEPFDVEELTLQVMAALRATASPGPFPETFVGEPLDWVVHELLAARKRKWSAAKGARTKERAVRARFEARLEAAKEKYARREQGPPSS